MHKVSSWKKELKTEDLLCDFNSSYAVHKIQCQILNISSIYKLREINWIEKIQKLGEEEEIEDEEFII